MRNSLVMLFAIGIASGVGTSGFCDDIASVAKDSAVSASQLIEPVTHDSAVSAPQVIVPVTKDSAVKTTQVIAPVTKDSAVSIPATVTKDNVLPSVDRFNRFSVEQKKYLKTLVITNVLYAAGFGLYNGVVIPRSKKAEGTTETLKLMPISVLSAAMMYASLPMSVVASRKAGRNYELYYKESSRSLTLPLLFVGCGAFLGAVGVSYAMTINDYRDNNEIDGSSTKYETPAYLLLRAGTIAWAGTNLYSLIRVAVLGKKAKSKSLIADAVELSPWFCKGAGGAMVSWKF